VIGDDDAVLRANQAFYDAFEARDMDLMSDVWDHHGDVSCTHPGWQRLDGWGGVAASFLAIFQGPQPIQFILTNATVQVDGTVAWVTVDENILGDDAGATASGLNIFRRTSEGWKLAVHHSSQVLVG
jgi:ketosteroid isomerase-like protein